MDSDFDDQYRDLYKKYLSQYDMLKLGDLVKNTDLIIQRNGGDELTLMTEVVTNKKHSKLFVECVEENSILRVNDND